MKTKKAKTIKKQFFSPFSLLKYSLTLSSKSLWLGCHDIQQNDSQRIDTMHNVIDLKRITRYNLGIVRVGHFWKLLWFQAVQAIDIERRKNRLLKFCLCLLLAQLITGFFSSFFVAAIYSTNDENK